MNQKYVKPFFLTLLMMIFAGISLLVSTFAWIVVPNAASINSTNGFTATSYFARGKGTAEDPYIINKPIHLYNLAWLQYIGIFNQDKDGDGNVDQYYFKLETDIDMSGVVIPPIGTTQYPFVGNFDGSYTVDSTTTTHTISNLVVSNKLGSDATSISKKPASISSLSNVNIVGFFGVVGSYNGAPSVTYSSSINEVKNVYLSNANICTYASDTLIGVVAGYENGNISAVGVINSSVSVDSACTPLNDSGDMSNISDFGVVGFATTNYRSTITKSIASVYTPTSADSHFTLENEGDTSGWGGSIDMASMYKRLSYFFDQSTDYQLIKAETRNYQGANSTTPTSTTVTSTYGTYKYYVNSVAGNTNGQTLISPYAAGSSSKTYLYMNGYREMTKSVTSNRTTTGNGYTGHYITAQNVATSGNSTYYLCRNGTTLTGSTSATNAISFGFTTNNSTTGNMVCLINGTKYYLNATSKTALALQTTATSTWTYDATNHNLSTYYNGSGPLYIYYSSSWKIKTSDTYYVTNTENSAPIADSNSTFTYTSTTTTTANETYTTPETYYPLNVINKDSTATDRTADYNAKDTNTGYVISGGYSAASQTEPYGRGDIRVSQYTMNDITNSLGGSGGYLKSTFRAYTYLPGSGKTAIKDDDNATALGTTGTRYDDTSLNFQKYAASKASLDQVLNPNKSTSAVSTNIYGLHFMDSSILMSHRFTPTKNLLINGTTYTYEENDPNGDNYELPRDCIDFSIKHRGFINFFAGTYYSGNNTFFSIHSIFRNDNNKITNIREIKEVYGTSSLLDPFIYKYVTQSGYTDYSNNSNTSPAGTTGTSGNTYSLKLNMDWITNPETYVGTLDGADNVFYFEVPVNAGEFALGSVSGKDGAYMMYLDISANAQEASRTAVTELISTLNNVYTMPNGVAIVSSNSDTVSHKVSVDVALLTGFNGEITFSKTGTTIALSGATSAYQAKYVADGLTLSGTDPPVSSSQLIPTPTSTSTDIWRRLTWIDYNTSLGTTTITTMTETVINGVTTRTFTCKLADGTTVAGAEDDNTAIDTSALVNTFCVYSYYHDVVITNQDGTTTNVTISLESALSYTSSTPDANSRIYQTLTGLILKITSNVELSVTVSEKNGTLTISLGSPASQTAISTVPTTITIPITNP